MNIAILLLIATIHMSCNINASEKNSFDEKVGTFESSYMSTTYDRLKELQNDGNLDIKYDIRIRDNFNRVDRQAKNLKSSIAEQDNKINSLHRHVKNLKSSIAEQDNKINSLQMIILQRNSEIKSLINQNTNYENKLKRCLVFFKYMDELNLNTANGLKLAEFNDSLKKAFESTNIKDIMELYLKAHL
jgi:archaellum component FlaC